MEASSDLPDHGVRADLVGSGEVERLRAELARLRGELAASEQARDMAVDLAQAQEQRLAEIRALVDMAEWADSIEPRAGGAEPSVRVSDVRRAMR